MVHRLPTITLLSEKDILYGSMGVSPGTPQPSREHYAFMAHVQTSQAKMFEGSCHSILNSGGIPDVGLLGKIIQIFKNNGSTCDPANYRALGILGYLGELFTSIITIIVTLQLHLNKNQAPAK